MLSVVSKLPLRWWAGRPDCSFHGSISPSGASGSAPRVHCWMCPFPLRVHLLGSAREPGLRWSHLRMGSGSVFGQALGSRLSAAVFNAGFTPAACRGWFLSVGIFGWRYLKTNINCTTNVAVIIYGGQDGRCVAGGAEPIGLERGSWNHTSGDPLRLGQALRLRSWYPVRSSGWVFWAKGCGEAGWSFDHQAAAVRLEPPCGTPSAKRWFDAGHHGHRHTLSETQRVSGEVTSGGEWHREVTGSSRRKSSEGSKPKSATGTK